MPQSKPMPSRRTALKFLSSAPFLPMATFTGMSLPLVACGGGSDASVKSVSFTGMAAPLATNAAAMAMTTVDSSMVVTYSDDTTKSFKLAYEKFFLTGDPVPNGSGGTTLAGAYYNIVNQPILDTSAGGSTPFYSDCPDGMSLLKLSNPTVSGVTGNAVFAVVQFEYKTKNAAGASMYGQLPSPIAVVTLDQNKTTGKLSVVKYHNVDTSSVAGLWITCGASLSPWNTHLSSEEYEPDATKAATDTQLMAFSKNLFGSETTANPYDYGHMPEVTVNPDGTGSIKKHYCMGRISHELVQVMPDERTVLMGDDWTNGGLFMFVADKARDLSAGTLYVAKWTQLTSTNGGSATLGWIKLGHATSDEIKALAKSLKSTQIMDVKTSDPVNTDYTKIRYSGKDNWVKVVSGMDKAAAFLETHRYAALMGASMGFTKMEGTTVNIKDKVAYSAMSSIRDSMVDGTTDVKVTGPKAGAVYAMNMKGSQKDSANTAIDSDWVPVDMGTIAALVGEDMAKDAMGNTAVVDKIANPDNLKFSESMRTLFIGEDSGAHVNNFLWAYNVDTKKLSRLLSCPAGAESTGLQSVDNINGFTYIMSNFQHAGDMSGLASDVTAALNANYKNGNAAAVGYLTGFPAA
jgi:uncharacterized protein